MKATARVITESVKGIAMAQQYAGRVIAYGLPTGITATATIDERKNLFKAIRVTPETPQWMTPYGIDYKIFTQLDWQII